jgi:putative membrane protein
MEPLTEAERTRIARAICEAERRTSGEIVAIVAPASAGYRVFAALWAAVLALMAPTLLLWVNLSAISVYLSQLAVFGGASILLQWEPVRMRLVPDAVKKASVHKAAIAQFLAQNLHTAEGRTGVLIYVSLAERCAEIIADDGIYRKVPPEIWVDVIETLISFLKQGQPAEGFVTAVERCGNILAEHFPTGSENENVLPNHLIVLP